MGLARVAITPRTQAAKTSQAIVSAASGLGRWCARAARSFALRRRAGSTQERGEHRDRCRVLNALRETMLGPGAPRIVRADLPDRGALLVAQGLPCGATVRARPVRPSRPRCMSGTGRRAREARDGTTPGTVTHRDRPSGLRTRQRPPLTPIARPAPAYRRRCGSSIGGPAWRRQSAVPAGSPRVRSFRRTGRPVIGRGRMRPVRPIDDAPGGFIEPGPVMGTVRGSSGGGLADQEAAACPVRPVVAWSGADGRTFAGHGSASRSICRSAWSSEKRSARLGSGGVYAVSRSMAVR